MSELIQAPVVASAIVIPEPEDLPQPKEPTPPAAKGQSLKRRQSENSDTDSKRRRLSNENDINPPRKEPSPPRDSERRKSRQVEERKRGQRLFGALLGTLSQGSSNAAQKRRAEIENRQRARLKEQDQEDEARRKERLEQLKERRRKEQWVYEEKTMRLRHRNMLHFAKFMRTKTEPPLYYKPWELTAEQEDDIAQQLDDARAQIGDEVDAFEQRRERAQEAEEDRSKPIAKSTERQVLETSRMDTDAPAYTAPASVEHEQDAPVQEDGIDTQDDPKITEDEANDSPATSATAVNEMTIEEEMLDVADGEQVVEAEEDTVIY